MKQLSRRHFLSGAGTVGVAPVLMKASFVLASDKDDLPKVLNYQQWKTVEAITALLIPTDDEPGAVEANCVNFIDKALVIEEKQSAPVYLFALNELDRIVRKNHQKSFSQLNKQQQEELLTQMQQGQVDGWKEKRVTQDAFFNVILAHTVMGFLGDPKYGGNRNHVGWQVAGFPGHVHMLGGATKEHMQGKKKLRAVWGAEL